MSLAKTYVEWELTAQNLTFSQACELMEIPEETVEAFLAAPFSCDPRTSVMIIILLGAILGSSMELARVCGFELCSNDSPHLRHWKEGNFAE